MALTVLVVGMTTVFLILGLVVLTGNTLIKVVNKFAPIPIKEKVSKSNHTIQETVDSKNSAKLAVIIAAVEAITKGKGRIQKVEKK